MREVWNAGFDSASPESLAVLCWQRPQHPHQENLTSSISIQRTMFEGLFQPMHLLLFSELLCWCSAPRSFPSSKGVERGYPRLGSHKSREEKPKKQPPTSLPTGSDQGVNHGVWHEILLMIALEGCY
jgi:hypothetical protein